MNKKFLAISLASFLCLGSIVQADDKPHTSITRTSPNHTTIVIHDYSPRAQQLRAEQAEKAQQQLELKRQRAHEIELAEIRAGANRPSTPSYEPAPVVRQSELLPTIAERQRAQAYQPAPFFNGGFPTTNNIAIAGGFFNGFGGFGVGNFGFPVNYGVGNVCHPGVRGGGFRGGGIRGGGFRGGGIRGGGFRGGGFRGGGFRGGGVRGGGCR